MRQFFFFSFQTMSTHPTECDIKHFKSNFLCFLVNGCQTYRWVFCRAFWRSTNGLMQAQNNTAICWPQTGLESKIFFFFFLLIYDQSGLWGKKWWIDDGTDRQPLTWSKWAKLFWSLLSPNHLVGSRKNSAVVGKPGRTVTRSCCSLTPVD